MRGYFRCIIFCVFPLKSLCGKFYERCFTGSLSCRGQTKLLINVDKRVSLHCRLPRRVHARVFQNNDHPSMYRPDPEFDFQSFIYRFFSFLVGGAELTRGRDAGLYFLLARLPAKRKLSEKRKKCKQMCLSMKEKRNKVGLRKYGVSRAVVE